MRATGPYQPADPRAVAEQVEARLASWDVPSARAGLWAMAAADHVSSPGAQWTLEYDADMGVVSFEIWHAGQRLFGLDDWVG